MMDELKKLLPAWYDGIYEMQVLMDVETSLLQELLNHIKTAQSNQYISTADSQTIAMYEQMLRIAVDPSDTLELRRFRVLTRIASQKPYTLNYLRELLSSFGPVELDMLYNDYKLIASMSFEQIGEVSEIEYIFRSVVPANIVVEINNSLRIENHQVQPFLASVTTANEVVEI